MAERTIVIERESERAARAGVAGMDRSRRGGQVVGAGALTTPREKIEFDLRTGGVCRMTMVGPDGVEYANDGHFGVVEPPARLSLGRRGTDNPMIESGETTVEFIDLGEDRTKLVITSRIDLRRAAHPHGPAGWSSQLDKLETLLAG